MTLPATLRGRSETTILARSGGYLAAWHKTIGDRVDKGELLATIEAPEQDQELREGLDDGVDLDTLAEHFEIPVELVAQRAQALGLPTDV